MLTRLYHPTHPYRQNRHNKPNGQSRLNGQSRNWALPAFLTAIIFLSFISASSARQSDVSLGALGDLTFKGIYFSFKAGFVKGYKSEDAFTENYVRENYQENPNFVPTRFYTQVARQPQNGFGAHWAIGSRIDWNQPLWTRSELEIGFHRYAIHSQLNQIRPSRNQREIHISENDRAQMISVLWNNLFHPLPMHSAHQIWAGFGLGGGFVRTDLSQIHESGFGLRQATTRGANFIAALSFGYDYRILERSQFSMEYLRLGFNARYLVSEGFRAERTSQLMVELSYGF